MPPNKPSLTIDLPNSHNVFTFKPPQTPSTSRRHPPYSTSDPVEVRGSLDLLLPTKRHVKSINVALKSQEDVISKFGYRERELVLNETLHVQADEIMHQGVHRYEFSFIVNTRTPAFERHKNGTVFQWLEATVDFNEFFSRPLISKVHLIFIVHPYGGGYIPFEHIHHDFIDNLGPYEISLKTQHLTVAGYIELQIYLASPEINLSIRSVSLKLKQQTTIHSKDGKSIDHLEPQIHQLLALGSNSTDLIISDDGSAIQSRWLARLPIDDQCRPSTVEWSNNRLRQKHELILDLVYKKDKIRCVTITVPIILPTCLLSVESVTLPTYSDAGYPVPSKRFWDLPVPNFYYNCSCGRSSEVMKAVAEGVNNVHEYVKNSHLRREGIWKCDIRRRDSNISDGSDTNPSISGDEIRAAKRVNEYQR